MKSYEAYCAVCDADVRVILDPSAVDPLAGARVECLDGCPNCDAVLCPLEGATPEELRDRLEFLPPEARGAGPGAALSDPDEAIEQGRIQAMRRGQDPVP